MNIRWVVDHDGDRTLEVFVTDIGKWMQVPDVPRREAYPHEHDELLKRLKR